MAGAASWSFNEQDFKQIQQHLSTFLRDSSPAAYDALLA